MENFSTIINKESKKLFEFYEELLNHLMGRHSIHEDQVANAIEHMELKYRKMKHITARPIDYDNICNCVGYLHKYAGSHSCMVLEVMLKILKSVTSR
ncbi:hypothetical protein CDAR_231711 [Caerostris darwini]|uniref:Uncharacterized protein n=1 Tax=Caerostris darwini TaxID=1538125 RepID=A0AAV4X633_9ARAC|nr:hypothetical protein CDAR_231581 [Caerostris darwini]GIY90106.1 hypothetical protein CDAR_231711 [Caerostris darwini]